MQHPKRSHATQADVGQGVVLMLVPIALVITVAIAVADVAVRIAHRSHAQLAADASALAGASSGRIAAQRIATLNGGQLIDYQELVNLDGLSVLTVVEVAGETASARASTEP